MLQVHAGHWSVHGRWGGGVEWFPYWTDIEHVHVSSTQSLQSLCSVQSRHQLNAWLANMPCGRHRMCLNACGMHLPPQSAKWTWIRLVPVCDPPVRAKDRASTCPYIYKQVMRMTATRGHVLLSPWRPMAEWKSCFTRQCFSIIDGCKTNTDIGAVWP